MKLFLYFLNLVENRKFSEFLWLFFLGTNRSCVAMQTKVPSGFWVDTPCGTLAGAVCEKLGQGQTTPKAPSTTPNSVPCPTGWVEVNRFCYQVCNKVIKKKLKISEAVNESETDNAVSKR